MHGQIIPLRRKDLELLAFLVENADRAVSKEELLTADGNMRAAFIISERGTDFTPWMTYLDTRPIFGDASGRYVERKPDTLIEPHQRLSRSGGKKIGNYYRIID